MCDAVALLYYEDDSQRLCVVYLGAEQAQSVLEGTGCVNVSVSLISSSPVWLSSRGMRFRHLCPVIRYPVFAKAVWWILVMWTAV